MSEGTPRPLPINLSAPVAVPVPGYEGIAIRFVISRSKAGVKAAGAGGDAAAAAYLIGEITDWPFECAAPKPGDPASFDECEAWGLDLAAWVIKDGFREALKSVIDPN